VLLAVIGIQVVYVIKEIRQVIRKVNSTVDNISGFTNKVSSSVGSLAGLGAGMSAALSLISILKKRSADSEKEE